MEKTEAINKYVKGDISRKKAVEELMKSGMTVEQAEQEIDRYTYQ